MTITAVEVVSNENNRRVVYRGQDHNLVWHSYGPCTFRAGDADPTIPANHGIADKLDNLLKINERTDWLLGKISANDLEHIGKPALRSWVRRQYRQSTGQSTWYVAKRIVESIASGEYTENNWRNEFGKTANQWNNTFYPKLQTQAGKYDDLQTDEGE